MNKTLLRAELGRRRAACDPARAAHLAAAFPAALFPGPGAVVAGYVRFRTEIDPAPLMAALADAGAELALPVTPTPNAPLLFRRWRPGAPLTVGRYGVREPDSDAPLVRPDLVLAPLLGFDRAGGRLGYGQGHYDRTLATLRADGPLLVIGLAFAEQEAPLIPMEAHDARLDWIVTDREAIAVQPPRG